MQILSQMGSIYGSGTVCWTEDNCVPLEGTDDSLSTLFATSQDEPALKFAWSEWRKNVGRPMKPYYEQVPCLEKLSFLNLEFDFLFLQFKAYIYTLTCHPRERELGVD
jgi:hypothetical protein